MAKVNKVKVVVNENEDCREYQIHGMACEEMFTCCDCGGNDCGCSYCWSCNACDTCKGK